MDSLTEWFIRQIAEGDASLDAAAIMCLSDQLGVQLGAGNFFCVAVQYTNNDLILTDASKLMSLFKACRHAAKSIKNNVYCYIGNDFRIVMMISSQGLARMDVVSLVYGAVSRRLPDKIQMGVGRVIQSIEKLNISKVEAYEALRIADYRLPIAYIEDIYVHHNLTMQKLERERKKIIELFKANRQDEMMESMVALSEKIRVESPVRDGMPYPTSIRRTILEILVEIMHISSDIGVDVEAVLNYQNPYTRIFEFQETPEILGWFYSAVRSLRASIDLLSENKESNMLRLSKIEIEDNISNPELSLSMIGDALGITPAYFSAFFMREMGVGFNEYITAKRIELAKDLLSNTNVKINQIAEDCGFRSPSYFNTVFRKSTGITPGEYRNQQK